MAMKLTIAVATLALVAADYKPPKPPREFNQAEAAEDVHPLFNAGRDLNNYSYNKKKHSSEDYHYGTWKSSKSKSKDHEPPNEGWCGVCSYDTFYKFQPIGAGDDLETALFKPPAGCVLAAIRDETSLKGAQYAIPPGEIAITQGFIPIAEYIECCEFDTSNPLTDSVTGCDYDYQEFFMNFEYSKVPDGATKWVEITYPFEAGAVYAAIGSDGLLRPVKQWNTQDIENFGYSGAVYECCPDEQYVCNEPEGVTAKPMNKYAKSYRA